MGGGVSSEMEFPVYTANICNPDKNTWDTIDTPLAEFTMTVLMGKLVIAGGYNRVEHIANDVFVLENNHWEYYTKMLKARIAAFAVSHQSLMFIMGGRITTEILSNVEVLDSTTGRWFRYDDLPQPLYNVQSIIVGNMVYMLPMQISCPLQQCMLLLLIHCLLTKLATSCRYSIWHISCCRSE